MAPQTVDSEAPPFAQPGRARDLAHASPVCIEIPITVQGSRQSPKGAAETPVPQPFVEETRTVLAFEQGAVLRMTETTVPGQILILKNLRMNREAACRVVNYKARENVKGYVEIEFLEPAPGFWGIEFPAPRADRSTSAAEQLNPASPRLSAPPAAPQSPKSTGKSQNSGVPLLPDLLSPESQKGLVSAREASPSSLFGFEPPKATPAAPPPEVAPPPAIEKETRPAAQQRPRPEDPASLTDLLDSLTPLGEQVLLGKGLGQGTAHSSLRKTPVPGASSLFTGAPASDKPVEKKSQDFSLQVSAELVRAEIQAQTASHPSREFERPSPSAEPIFSSPPRKHSNGSSRRPDILRGRTRANEFTLQRAKDAADCCGDRTVGRRRGRLRLLSLAFSFPRAYGSPCGGHRNAFCSTGVLAARRHCPRGYDGHDCVAIRAQCHGSCTCGCSDGRPRGGNRVRPGTRRPSPCCAGSLGITDNFRADASPGSGRSSACAAQPDACELEDEFADGHFHIPSAHRGGAKRVGGRTGRKFERAVERRGRDRAIQFASRCATGPGIGVPPAGVDQLGASGLSRVGAKPECSRQRRG